MLYAGRHVRGKQSEGLRSRFRDCLYAHSSPWTVQDPAASCVGVEEVQEAFRALKALKPEHLAAPKAIPGEEPGSTRVALNQRYLGGLQVRLTTCAVADICACEISVCSMQASHSVLWVNRSPPNVLATLTADKCGGKLADALVTVYRTNSYKGYI